MEPEHTRTRIDVVDCAKTYPDSTRGLQSTTLTVEPGEVLALLGPSGCGKTTLLRIIAGLETPDAGSRILFDGTDVTALPVEQRGIGMVFQHYALFPQMTAAANIGYGLRIRGVSDTERRRAVGELIDLVRLNGLENKRPAELSGGQRQRVALARAVAVRPRVLLLDEPLTAQEALAIADRLAVMQAGRIVQVGHGEALYRRPDHPFVAVFLGRVNRLERTALDRANRVLSIGGLTLPCAAALDDQSALLVRPEDIEVGQFNIGWGQAVVTRRSFLGDRVQLTLAEGAHVSLQADVARDHAAQLGETVGIRIQPERLMPCHEPTRAPHA